MGNSDFSRAITPKNDSDFLSPSTAEVVEWEQIWKAFQPVTSYGKDKKSALRPFLPGHESAWNSEYCRLEADVHVLSPVQLNHLQVQLQAIPDVTQALQHLDSLPKEASFTPLSIREALGLKQFAYHGRQIAAVLAAIMQDLWSESQWTHLLTAFGHIEDSSFSIQHIGTDSYQAAAHNYSQATHRHVQATRRWVQTWKEKTGCSPNRDGQIVCSLPAQRDVAKILKQTDGVEWYQDTPFESIFSVSPTSEMHSIQSEVEHWQSVMDSEAQQILRLLTSKLQRQKELWKEAVGQVGELDLRAAKVALWRQWGGCRPVESNAPAVSGGIHPLLLQRLVQIGRDYVPLNWGLNQGTNVVTGSNMGGKTVALKSLAICQLCAQYGLPIPAKQFATRLYAVIRFYAEAHTSIESGLSSFGFEVTQIREAWRCTEDHSGDAVLLLFDEPGRSTNPVEGEALVVGLLKTLPTAAAAGSVVVIATHFAAAMRESGISKFRVRGVQQVMNDVDEMGDSSAQLDNRDRPEDGEGADLEHRLAILAKAMDFRIEPVTGSEYDYEGLRIAAWLGIPTAILQHSQQYLSDEAQTIHPDVEEGDLASSAVRDDDGGYGVDSS